MAIRTAANTPRITIPLLKTSLSPRFPNCLGINRSRARKEARRGKSAKAVLAANTRTAAVNIWVRR